MEINTTKQSAGRVDAEYKRIFDEAYAAAKAATASFIAKYGNPMYCGFAWVTLPDGRSPAVKAFKKLFPKEGHKGHPTGWEIWNPGGSYTQSMDVKECGASAFAKTLVSYGIDAYMGSRAD